MKCKTSLWLDKFYKVNILIKNVFLRFKQTRQDLGVFLNFPTSNATLLYGNRGKIQLG